MWDHWWSGLELSTSGASTSRWGSVALGIVDSDPEAGAFVRAAARGTNLRCALRRCVTN